MRQRAVDTSGMGLRTARLIPSIGDRAISSSWTIATQRAARPDEFATVIDIGHESISDVLAMPYLERNDGTATSSTSPTDGNRG